MRSSTTGVAYCDDYHEDVGSCLSNPRLWTRTQTGHVGRCCYACSIAKRLVHDALWSSSIYMAGQLRRRTSLSCTLLPLLAHANSRGRVDHASGDDKSFERPYLEKLALVCMLYYSYFIPQKKLLIRYHTYPYCETVAFLEVIATPTDAFQIPSKQSFPETSTLTL